MPFYEYENKRTGERSVEYRKSDDSAPKRGWFKVYDSISSASAYCSHSSDLEKTLTSDYKTYEQRHGCGSVERDLGIKTNTIKKSVSNYVSTFGGKEDEE